jgi:hypothetical protein
MSYINGRGEVQQRDRPGFAKLPDRLSIGDTVKPLPSVLTRPGEVGAVVWALGNQVIIRFGDDKRLHYWRHEIERAP